MLSYCSTYFLTGPNDYRLVTSVDFEKGIVWIKWVGTHKDYDRINVEEVEYEKS